MSSHAFITILCMFLVFAWARSTLVLMCSFACRRSMMFAQRKLRLTMQHVYGHSGNLGNEFFFTILLNLAHSGLPLTTTLSLVGKHLNFDAVHVLAVRTSMRFWNYYNEFELGLSLFPNFGASIFFIIGSSVSFCVSRAFWMFCVLVPSPFSFFGAQQWTDISPSVSTAPSLDDDFEHNIWNLVLNLLFLEQVGGVFASF